jgi:S-adenosylhomocysteine hydrolase
MPFDIRLPIGLLFLGIGVLVAGYGLVGDQEALRAHSAGLNIDLVWGSVMAAFGAVMLGMVALARRKRSP